jgi:O-antigen/teichoic acid export membrane protein
MDLARSGTKLFLSKILGTLISFLGIVYFARELGASALGAFFLFEALSGILVILSNFGTRVAIEKRMSEGEFPSKIFTTGILIKIPIIVAVITGVLIFSEPVNRYVGIQIAGLLALTVVIKECAHFMENVLKGELRVGESAVLKIINKIVWISTAVILVSVGYGVYGLIYGVMAGFSAKFLLRIR